MASNIDPTGAGSGIRIRVITDEILEIWRDAKGNAAYRFQERPTGDKHSIHTIICHHSAGQPADTNPKNTAFPDVPQSLHNATRRKANSSNKVHDYDYEIGFVRETAGGRNVVYRCLEPEIFGRQTGGQNTSSVGVSMLFTARGLHSPIGYLTNSGSPSSNEDAANPRLGQPSVFQLACLSDLLDYLQEEYDVADTHVQGHFLHRKEACPGYDIERFLVARQDRNRRFCYPVKIGGATTVPLLDHTAVGPDPQAAAYMHNATLNGGASMGGTYPFGRRQLWHGGIHLFPTSFQDVHCVRDGWLLAARVKGTLTTPDPTDGSDRAFGSRCFVLVMHKDPGARIAGDARSRISFPKEACVPHMIYYSLYMHLEPHSGAGDEPAWLTDLNAKDGAAYTTLTGGEDISVFGDLALPVKTGDIIGRCGEHNPFALDHISGGGTLTRMLHFEMFSPENLVERFDPDRNIHNDWTTSDTDHDPIADIGQALPAPNAAGDNVDAALRTEITDHFGATTTPAQTDWDLTLQFDPAALNTLSKVITKHKSEWFADWGRIPSAMRRKWGVSDAEMATFRRDIVTPMQWLREINGSVSRKSQLAGKVKLVVGSSSLPRLIPSEPQFFYHPIRLLNWLNGMRREVDDDGTPPADGDLAGETTNRPWDFARPGHDCPTQPMFLGTNDRGITHDSSTKKNFIKVITGGAAGDRDLVLGPYVRKHNADGRLVGVETPLHEPWLDPGPGLPKAIVKFLSGSNRGHEYVIQSVGALSGSASNHRAITLNRGLDERVRTGDKVQIRNHYKRWSWKWRRNFDWNQDITP